MKLLSTALFATFSVASIAHAASYVTDFESFLPPGSDIAGQDGWTISNGTDQYSQVSFSNANPANPFFDSQALNLGDAEAVVTPPITSFVSLTNSYAGAIGTTSLYFDFIIFDSTDGNFTSRDTFGVSFSSGISNVFAISFVPTAQSATPSSGPVAQWNAIYQIGSQPLVALNLGILEDSQYNFNLAFNANAGNPLLSDFLLTITSAVPNVLSDGGIAIALDPTTATSEFNVNWIDGDPSYGSNSIVIDNLGVVPEPSSALLVGLAALGFISRRKRA